MKVDRYAISDADAVLLHLAKSATGAPDAVVTLPAGRLSAEEWRCVYAAAVRGGVGALAWDAVRRLDVGAMPPRELRLKWGIGAEAQAVRHAEKRAVTEEFADRMAGAGIRTYCIKGLALGECYPRPELRECGDFDCWMGDDFERGNRLAVSLGASFDPHDYRHSVLMYKGLMVENHRYFLAIRGNEANRRMERYLRRTIGGGRPLGATDVLLPSAQFHALFVTLHNFRHFLFEGVRLRHLCDWTCFVNRQGGEVDWAEFGRMCDAAGAGRFAAAVNDICARHLGMRPAEGMTCDGTYSARILLDTLSDGGGVSGICGLWRQRMARVRYIVANRWKFGDIYSRSVFAEIARSCAGIVFDPHPTL